MNDRMGLTWDGPKLDRPRGNLDLGDHVRNSLNTLTDLSERNTDCNKNSLNDL